MRGKEKKNLLMSRSLEPKWPIINTITIITSITSITSITITIFTIITVITIITIITIITRFSLNARLPRVRDHKDDRGRAATRQFGQLLSVLVR